MSGKLDLIELMKKALAEGEEFDARMRAAGYRMSRDICLRAYIELFSSGTPGGSQFFVHGGPLFRGGELLHRQHPNMPIVVTAWDDIWLPVSEVVDDLWKEVAQLASEHPERFREAVRSVLDADLAFDACPP